MLPEEVKRETWVVGKALMFQKIEWVGSDGKTRIWETAERASGRGAVMIIPWLMPEKKLILIRQYRPPLRGLVIEFPAGLIDPGETVEEAAKRELREEAGYEGEVTEILPPTYNTPGLSSESVFHVYMHVDSSKPENQNPKAQPDDGEHVETLLVSFAEIESFLMKEWRENGQFDSKVMAYLRGLLGKI